MNRSFFSIVIWLVLLVIESCCKSDPPKPLTELEKLPPATQSGKYTMGCLLNGKAFVPVTTIDVTAIYQQGILQLGGGIDNPAKSIGIIVYEKNYGPLTTKSYELNKYPDSFSDAHIQITDTTY